MPAAVNGMKECTKCGETKDVSEYGKCNKLKDGLKGKCKECRRQYRQDNREHIAKKNKEYRQENREEILLRNKQYYEDNKDTINEKRRELYRDDEELRQHLIEYQSFYRQDESNKKKIAKRQKQWREDNKESISIREKKWREDNKDRLKEFKKEYFQNNKVRLMAEARERRKQMPAALYEIECIPTGKTYVGQTTTYPKRMRMHKRVLRKGIHHNLALQSDYNKYGLDAFEFNIVSEYPSHTTSKILLEAEAIEILKRVRSKQEIYNNAIPQDDGKTFIDVDYTEEEFAKIIENSIKLDMTMTEFVCKAIHDFNLSHLPQNNSETKEE